MVVRVFIVGLEDIVINVLGRQLHPHGIDSKRLEFEHRERTGCVLQKGMIHPHCNSGIGKQITLDEVRTEYLMRKVLCHLYFFNSRSSGTVPCAHSYSRLKIMSFSL